MYASVNFKVVKGGFITRKLSYKTNRISLRYYQPGYINPVVVIFVSLSGDRQGKYKREYYKSHTGLDYK